MYSVERGIGAMDTGDVDGGKSHRLGTFNGKFPHEIRWSPDGHTLFANYWRTAASTKGQIGFLSGTGGDIEQITRDTNKNTSLPLSSVGSTLATVRATIYTTMS